MDRLEAERDNLRAALGWAVQAGRTAVAATACQSRSHGSGGCAVRSARDARGSNGRLALARAHAARSPLSGADIRSETSTQRQRRPGPRQRQPGRSVDHWRGRSVIRGCSVSALSARASPRSGLISPRWLRRFPGEALLLIRADGSWKRPSRAPVEQPGHCCADTRGLCACRHLAGGSAGAGGGDGVRLGRRRDPFGTWPMPSGTSGTLPRSRGPLPPGVAADLGTRRTVATSPARSPGTRPCSPPAGNQCAPLAWWGRRRRPSRPSGRHSPQPAV